MPFGGVCERRGPHAAPFSQPRNESMAKKQSRRKVTMPRAARTRSRMPLDEAMLAVLIAAMDANGHVSRQEAWRAHHIIWSMRRFRNRRGEQVDRLIDKVRAAMVAKGKDLVLQDAIRTLPSRARSSAFAVAVDLMLADTRLDRDEKRFLRELAAALKLRPGLADEILRVLIIKNTA